MHSSSQSILSQMEPEQYFRMAYTKVFGVMELQDISVGSQQLYRYIVKFILDQHRGNYNILSHTTNKLEYLIRKISGAHRSHYKIAPRYSYGCALIFQKVYVVFNQSWEVSNSYIGPATQLFPVPSPQFSIFYIGMINNTCALNQASENFLTVLHKVIECCNKEVMKNPKVKNHKTPSWFMEACQVTLKALALNMSDSALALQINAGFTSKGGTYDVGYHIGLTKPDTLWCVSWAIISFFAQDPELVKALMVNYQAYLLRKFAYHQLKEAQRATSNSTYYSQKSAIASFMSCLLYLRSEFQKLNGESNYYYNNERACKQIQQIAQIIHKIDIPAVEVAYSLEEMGKHADYSQPHLDISKLVPKMSTSKQTVQQSMKNLSTTLIIDPSSVISSCIDQFSKCINKHVWIMGVQDTLFTLAHNQLLKEVPFQQFNIDIVIRTPLKQSQLFKLLNLYIQQMSTNYRQFGIILECQAHSHIELMRALICIIAFQIYKRQYAQTFKSIDQYRVPINIQELYQAFNSLSFKARMAVQRLYEYHTKNQRNKDNKPKINFFDQGLGYSNYKLYAQKVGRKIESIVKTYEKKEKQLELAKQVLIEKLIKYHKQRQQMYDQLKRLKSKVCECFDEQYEQDYYNYGSILKRMAKRKVQCKWCKKIKQQENQIKRHEEKTENTIKTCQPKNDGIVHQFFCQLDDQLNGLISLALYCQHSQRNLRAWDGTIILKKINELFNAENLRVSTVLQNKGQFRLVEYMKNDIQQLVGYASDQVTISWNNAINPTISYQSMCSNTPPPPQSQYRNNLDFLINPKSPPDNLKEHSIYAKLNQKPAKIKLEQYIALGSCRIGQFTQIPVCLQALLKRSIQIDLLSQNYLFKLYVIYRCLSSVQAYKTFRLQSHICENISEGVLYYFKDFIAKYYKSWKPQDFNALPIMGPLISLISRLITKYSRGDQNLQHIFTHSQIDTSDTEIKARLIMKKIFKQINLQYQQIQADNQKNSGKDSQSICNNRANQCYLAFGGLCCFTELQIDDDDDLAIQFVKMIVIMRFKQVYLELTKNQLKYAKIMKQYSSLKDQAIENNIRTVLKYFKNNLTALTQVVSVIDNTISQTMRWKKDQDGDYVFRGQDSNKNIYKIDIKHGKVIKNGQTVSRIPDIFKSCPQYRKIFQDRDFQVNPSPGSKNALRATRNFIDLFVGNVDKDDTILFEFAYVGQKTAINMIVRYNQNENEDKNQRQQTWRLINNDQLCKMVPIPAYFAENYYAWYCAERSCIVFRKPILQKIGQVALVAFVDKSERAVRKITKIHVISKQHYRSHFDEICNPDKKIFHKLILRNNQQKKQSLAIQVLSRIQKKQFILELQSYEMCLRKFWLHRFDLIFIQDETHGILPQNLKGYRVSENPYSNRYLPWSEKDKIRCLVFEKYTNDEFTQQLHKFKIAIPNGSINDKSQLPYPDSEQEEECSYFLYDLHDHFKDMRGTSRQSQLYLASILCAINKNIRHPRLNITPIQYAIKIIKSCFGNSPLEYQQNYYLKKIMSISICQQNQSLLLLCYALNVCSKQISYNRMFGNSWQYQYKYDQFKNIIGYAMSKYTSKMKEGRLPYRQRLPDEIANIIGLKFNNENSISKGRVKNWRNKNKLQFKLPNLAMRAYFQHFQTELQEWRQFNNQIMGTVDVESKQNEQMKQKQFPLNIQNPQDNQLLQEVTKQLEGSYNIYHENKINFNSIKVNKQRIKVKLKQIKQKMEKSKDLIERILRGVGLQNKTHVDILSGFHPVLSTCDYINLLIQNIQPQTGNPLIQALFPDLGKTEQENKNKEDLLILIKYWILFSIKLDSSQRIQILIKHDATKQSQTEADKIALFRQCESPRQQIESKIYWICFQVQMKIQIWKSQYQTYKTLLLNNQSGSISQLNMGEGKTQIIIPMIALQLLYDSHLQELKIFEGQTLQSNVIPRINFMESLLKQSYVNYFKFLSITAFNIPLIILPFDRGVNFKDKQNLNSIIRSLGNFKNKMIILLDQSSTHSLILKLRQETIRSQGRFISDKQKTIFKNMLVFDIFDEADAQLTAKKSFIYSEGKSDALDERHFRTLIAAGLLQALCYATQKLLKQQIVAFDQTQKQSIYELTQGEFPKGYRLIANILATESKKYQFRKYLLSYFFQDTKTKTNQCQFMKALTPDQQEQVIEYIVKDSESEDKLSKRLPEYSRKYLYSLRGYLAYGIFEHCLSLRCRVNYGVPDEERKYKKRLAVPFQAADIPSKKNDYAHPDVAILLSYLSYYNFGLNEDEVNEGIKQLLKQTDDNEDARQQIFKSWIQIIKDNKLSIKKASEIKIHSVTQREELFRTFRLNRKFISFFLQNCVFVKDMEQFKHSITSSSWDHSKVRKSMGFSGTKDNCRLFPTYVKLVTSDNKEIAGTDGKMLDLLIQNVKQVKTIKDGSEPLWERFIKTVFSLSHDKISSIIDAGAILASKPLKEYLVPFIAKHKNFNLHQKFKGISFCSDNKWSVYKLSSHQYIDRGTSIADNQTFVIFDEYRTRGADMKMNADIIAVLTLSPLMTKDALMQAVGRLRKLGRDQKVVILMTEQIQAKLKRYSAFKNNQSTQEKVKAVLSWSCQNSVKENERYLLPNTKLANIHFKNVNKPHSPYIDESDTSLKKMYASPLSYKTIANLCENTITEIIRQELNSEDKKKIEELKKISSRYGNKTKIKAQNFDEVCERQTEIIRQFINQRETEVAGLMTVAQNDEFVTHNLKEYHNFKFGDKIKISQNFQNCTKAYSHQRMQSSNELMYTYFVLLCQNYICMITQRQVYQLLVHQGIPFYRKGMQHKSNKYIARFYDFRYEDSKENEDLWWYGFIKQNNLTSALVYCRFFNGVTQYSKEQQYVLTNLIKNQQNKKQKIQYFLNLRKQSYKFSHSTLMEICRTLEQMPENYDENSLQQRIIIDRRALLRGQKRRKQHNQQRKKPAEQKEEKEGDEHGNRGEGKQKNEKQR